ncbi:MAG: hypothetical protein ACRDLS_13560 [Solirubrobacteraceae bacterium]
MLRRVALGLGLAVALAAAGCGGDGGGDGDDDGGGDLAGLKRFVITPADLPDGYEREENRNSTSPDTCLTVETNPSAERALKQRFAALGFGGCSAASYRKEVDTGVKRNNRPANQAMSLRDAEAAGDAVALLRETLLDSFKSSDAASSAFEPRSIAATGLGDEAQGIALSVDLGEVLGPATFLIYVWRRGNVAVWLGSSDFVGDFDQRSTLQLARTLDARGAG